MPPFIYMSAIPFPGTHLGFRELAMENKPYGANMKPFTSYVSGITGGGWQ